MKYFIATDHAGINIKDFVIELLKNKNHTVEDLGPFDNNRVDYPDYAQKLCKEVIKDENSMGILICGTGLGMSMSANKFEGIRAALCHNTYSATMAREHNDANVLCLGERVSAKGMLENIINAWDNASFAKGRHTQRVEKINNIKSNAND